MPSYGFVHRSDSSPTSIQFARVAARANYISHAGFGNCSPAATTLKTPFSSRARTSLWGLCNSNIDDKEKKKTFDFMTPVGVLLLIWKRSASAKLLSKLNKNAGVGAKADSPRWQLHFFASMTTACLLLHPAQINRPVTETLFSLDLDRLYRQEPQQWTWQTKVIWRLFFSFNPCCRHCAPDELGKQ